MSRNLGNDEMWLSKRPPGLSENKCLSRGCIQLLRKITMFDGAKLAFSGGTPRSQCIGHFSFMHSRASYGARVSGPYCCWHGVIDWTCIRLRCRVRR
jgi:hypothetical protein